MANAVASSLVRAARYMRMSTEHQRYSLANQSMAIDEYARANGYEVVRSYADPAKSGLSIQGRKGLQALLADCLSGKATFQAILVLDVSRWGRFQDTDESAHYEFLCWRAGLQVHYCAEPFANDHSLFNSVAKALKRVMAAEYSRELSEKVRRGHRLQAELGHWQGSPAPYGFRRFVVNRSGELLRELQPGETKALKSDTVTIGPGPQTELKVIRDVFKMFVADRRSLSSIARRLNAAGIDHGAHRRKWSCAAVRFVLKNPLVVGSYTYCRREFHLNGPPREVPTSARVTVKLFPPIVSPALFRKANVALQQRSHRRHTDGEMLDCLRVLLKQHGYLTPRLINAAPFAPAAATYAERFGSVTEAYRRVGYFSRAEFKQPRTDEDTLQQLRGLHDRHGEVNTALLFLDPTGPSYADILRRFGSLRSAKALAGLPILPRRKLPRQWSNEELLTRLAELSREWGYLSVSLLSVSPNCASPTLYRTRFGSFREACLQAGIEVTARDLKAAQLRGRQVFAERLRSLPSSRK